MFETGTEQNCDLPLQERQTINARVCKGSKTKLDGTQRIKGTHTLFWINKEQVLKNRTATYARVVVDKRPEKEEVNQTQITAGGDRLEFQGDT